MFCMSWQWSGVVVMVSLAMAVEVASLQSQYQHNASQSVSWQGRQAGRQGVNITSSAQHQTLTGPRPPPPYQVRSGQVRSVSNVNRFDLQQ